MVGRGTSLGGRCLFWDDCRERCAVYQGTFTAHHVLISLLHCVTYLSFFKHLSSASSPHFITSFLSFFFAMSSIFDSLCFGSLEFDFDDPRNFIEAFSDDSPSAVLSDDLPSRTRRRHHNRQHRYVPYTRHPLTRIVLDVEEDSGADERLGKVRQQWYFPESCDGCTICLADEADVEQSLTLRKIGVLPCGHAYHTTCITPWLKNNATCPQCRTIVR